MRYIMGHRYNGLVQQPGWLLNTSDTIIFGGVLKRFILFFDVILLVSLIGIIITSCYTLDTISDISISLQPPETVIIKNNSYVSTLNSIKFEIKRNGKTVHTYDGEYLVTAAGEDLTIILDDFIIQDGDIGVIISVNLSWSM